jgi:ribonuclease HI
VSFLELKDIKRAIYAFTDGNAPRLNSKDGEMIGTVGWAFVKLLIRDGVIIKSKQDFGKIENATVDVAELQAIVEALMSYLPAAIAGTRLPITIVSDRQNLVKGFNEWIEDWVKHGWRNSSAKPVANVEYWKKAYKIKNELQSLDIEVSFVHMRGHRRGNDPIWMQEQNEIADRLAERGRDDKTIL